MLDQQNNYPAGAIDAPPRCARKGAIDVKSHALLAIAGTLKVARSAESDTIKALRKLHMTLGNHNVLKSHFFNVHNVLLFIIKKNPWKLYR